MGRRSRLARPLSALVALLFLLFPATLFADSLSSAHFRLSPAVISTGGILSSTTHFKTENSIGQPASPAALSPNGDRLWFCGLWHLIPGFFRSGDINGNGSVDLSDIIVGLQVLINMPNVPVTLEADMDGDGKIGFSEILGALQSVSQPNE